MSLNDIRLTPQLLAGLYGNVLIETVKKTATASLIPALGNNEKQILIVVAAAEPDAVLPQGDLLFLTNILGACKLTLADVAIVNHTTLSADYKQAIGQFESRFVLLFGITPVQFGLPLDFPPFQVQAFDSRQYLYAPALQKIGEAKNLKAELWTALKKLFLL